MKRFYSASTQASYFQGMHASMPADAVEISEELYLAVIGNPASGKIRAHDKKGLPYLVDAPAQVPDAVAHEREWRDAELASVMWLRERHRDQQEIGGSNTLSDDQFAELLVYMQALRDWPQSPEFPAIEQRPAAPAWIAEQAQ